MKFTYLDITVEGDLTEAELRLMAVKEAIKLEFGTVTLTGNNPPALTSVRNWAIAQIKVLAEERRSSLDDIVSDNITLANEIIIYYLNDRPTDPQPGIYVIANAMAVRRSVTLRAMLENLLTRWQAIQSKIADIMPELDRLLTEIENASTIEEVEASLASVEW